MKLKILSKPLWTFEELEEVCKTKGWRIPTFEELKNNYEYDISGDNTFFTSDYSYEFGDFGGKIISGVNIFKNKENKIIFNKVELNKLFKQRGVVVK